MTADRTIYRGSVENLDVLVTTTDLELVAQPVALSYDRTSWMSAEWIGDPGLARVARLLIDNSNFPASTTPVYVRVTDNPEAPVELAGILFVK